eukprot:Unigene4274_Nuclearia_a/m.13040 Unigene4274_Nuclearia_a/g.13040  ORF Unigene4274_Nuclearia_a/g.13040 Unigene4274_Nuclearia_a/m.13040 type:complete len:365 (+) Unigene4274_Nuclearia_a:176-1270(+)
MDQCERAPATSTCKMSSASGSSSVSSRLRDFSLRFSVSSTCACVARVSMLAQPRLGHLQDARKPALRDLGLRMGGHRRQLRAYGAPPAQAGPCGSSSRQPPDPVARANAACAPCCLASTEFAAADSAGASVAAAIASSAASARPVRMSMHRDVRIANAAHHHHRAQRHGHVLLRHLGTRLRVRVRWKVLCDPSAAMLIDASIVPVVRRGRLPALDSPSSTLRQCKIGISQYTCGHVCQPHAPAAPVRRTRPSRRRRAALRRAARDRPTAHLRPLKIEVLWTIPAVHDVASHLFLVDIHGALCVVVLHLRSPGHCSHATSCLTFVDISQATRRQHLCDALAQHGQVRQFRLAQCTTKLPRARAQR